MFRRLTIFISATLALSCARPENAPLDRYAGAPVILISIDTLRSDRLPAYGYEGVATPHIDALRRDAVLFRSAWSPCPITLPAHLSMLTGLLPPDHGVRANAGYRYDATKHPSLPRLLKAAGYASGASVSSWILRATTGIGPMFDDYDDAIVLQGTGALGENQRKGDLAAAYASRWIAAQSGRPFFFLLHLYEPHAPYEPVEPFRSRYAHAYDGEVATADAIVGRFLDGLRSSGVYDRAIVILTSDHGEGLMDHSEDQHGILLYREAIQVPLIIKLPQSQRGGETIDAPAQLSDLPATILALAGVAKPEPMPGADLFDRNLARDRRIYSETFYPRIHLGWSELRSLTDGKHHYIEAPRPELYDLTSDPAQRTNIIAGERRTAASMRTELAAIPKKLSELSEVDEELAGRLRSLGYLSAPAATGDDLPNPNEQVRHLATIKRGFLAAEGGRLEEAERALREVVAANPAMIEAALKLGDVLVEMRRHAEAIAVYENLLRRSERFSPDVALALAAAQLAAGAPGEAQSSARLALNAEPERANETLARIAITGKRWDEAARHAQAAAKGGQPRLMLIGAEVEIARGQYRRALEILDAAASRNVTLGGPALFRLEFLRGDALARLERIPESAAAYRREVNAFPRHLQAWGNLAVVYGLSGDEEKLRETLSEMVARNPQPAARAFAARVQASFR